MRPRPLRSPLLSAVAVLFLASPAFTPTALSQPASSAAPLTASQRSSRAAKLALRLLNKPWVATVKVLPGDTLYALSRASGVAVAQIERLNPGVTRTLAAGQTLRLRTAAQAQAGAVRAGRVAPAAAVKPPVPVVKAPVVKAPAPVEAGSAVVRGGAQQVPALPGGAVRLVRGPVLGVPVVIVNINLLDPRVFVTPLLPRLGLGTPGSLPLMGRTPGVTSVVNGGYFHPRTFSVTGDLVVGGRFLATGRVPTAIAITPGNRVKVYSSGQARLGWAGFETVIANGPHILRGGKVIVNPVAEGYRDAAVWGRAARSAIGVRSNHELFFLSTKSRLSLTELARVMDKAGARDAIVLDGGSSTGIAWRGRTLIWPSRFIAYGVGVYANYTGVRRTRG